MSERAPEQQRERRFVALAIVLGAAIAATVGTLLWSFWALVVAPAIAIGAAVRLAGRGELQVVLRDEGLRMTVPVTEGTTRKIVAASLAFSVAFAIPTLITTAIDGLIPTSPIVVFVALFIAIGIALAVRALIPTEIAIDLEVLELKRGRASRRVPFARIRGVERNGSEVSIDAGEDRSATIACAGPSMAQAVTTRIRDAVEARQRDAT